MISVNCSVQTFHFGHGQNFECISKSFRTESITKYTLTTNTRSEATQRVMEAKLTRLTHKITIQLHLVAESCTVRSSRSRRPVRKLLDTPSYIQPHLIIHPHFITTRFRLQSNFHSSLNILKINQYHIT
jgi:hypothetical protein